MRQIAGIQYTTTGNERRSIVMPYHNKPYPIELHKTPHRVDVDGLRPADKRNAIKFDGADFYSRFTIGFEVEKNQLSRGAVREYELFCGFERDGSCGFEAVTNILPLLPPCEWRTKVFDMMHKAAKIIEDTYSPSNQKCGGHVTIAVDGLTGSELNNIVRPYAGILLALFRSRLKNQYCGANRRMQDVNEDRFNSCQSSSYYGNGWHNKYQTALVKNNCLEFRLVSRFQSVRQMMRRYELFYHLVDFAVNVKGSHEAFLKRVRPTIALMYNNDEHMVNNVLNLSRSFRKFILENKVSADIQEYL